MTLTFDGHHKINNLVFCTSDSMEVTYFGYYKNGVKGDPNISRKGKNKIIPLTNKVLFRSGGISQLGKLFLKRLKKRVKYEDSLNTCVKHLKNIYNEMVEERGTGKGTGWLKYLYDERGIVIALNGFYDDGSTGTVIYNSEERTWEELTHDKRWVCTGVAPNDDGYEYLKRFGRIEEPGMRHMFNEFWDAHRQLCEKDPKKISDDMYVYAIKRIGDEYLHIKFHVTDINDTDQVLSYYQQLAELDSQFL